MSVLRTKSQKVSEYWSQKHIQSGSIHSIKLYVYAVKQSALNLSINYPKAGKIEKYYALASSPLIYIMYCHNGGALSLGLIIATTNGSIYVNPSILIVYVSSLVVGNFYRIKNEKLFT